MTGHGERKGKKRTGTTYVAAGFEVESQLASLSQVKE